MCNCGGGRVDIDFKTIKNDKKDKHKKDNKKDKHKKDKHKKNNDLSFNIKKIFGV